MRKTSILVLIALLSFVVIGQVFADKSKKEVPAKTSTVINSDVSKESKEPIKAIAPTSNNNDLMYNSLLERLKSSQTTTSSRTGEQILWQVISGGATNGSSASYQMMGTVGQTAIGSGSSASYELSHGYWQNFAGGTCCTLAGDVDQSGAIDITDLTFTVDFMFRGGPPPTCFDAADVNADCSQDITDLTYRVDFMFRGGPPMVCGCIGS